MYNYLEEIKKDVLEYVNNEMDFSDYETIEELEDFLNDELWLEDSVTGNASGSYTFNKCKAKEYVQENIDTLQEALKEFCVDSETIAEKFLDDDFEYFDVTIRCYLLSSAIAEALEEIETDFNNSKEKDITVFYTNGSDIFETCVTYKEVDEAIEAVEEEMKETEYHVMIEKTIERFENEYNF